MAETPSAPVNQDQPAQNVMTSMRQEIDRLFDDFAHRTPASWFGVEVVTPIVDITETDDAVEVTVELPGVDEKDIDVDVSGDVLTIRGEKKKEEEQSEKQYHRIERSYGAFRRSMRIPFEVDPDQVSATHDKGVLRVTLTKPAEAKKRSRKISVKSAK